MDLPPSAQRSHLFTFPVWDFFFSFPKLSAAPSKTGFTPWCHSLGRSVLSKIAVRSPFRLFLGGKNINHFSISALGAFAKFRLSSVKQRAWHRLLDLGLRDQRSVLSSAIKLFCDWGQISSCSSWCFLLRKWGQKHIFSFCKTLRFVDKKCWINAKYFLIMFADKLIDLSGY